MHTVASIAKRAFDAVAKRIGGVIHSASLKRSGVTDYDPDTAEINATAQDFPCRVLLADSSAISDVFPDFEVSPADQLAYIEGSVMVAKENDVLTLSSGEKFQLKTSRDLLNSKQFYAAVVRAA